MPVLALAGPIASALGASTALSAGIGAAGSIAGGLMSAKSGSNAMSDAANKAGQYTTSNIGDINSQITSLGQQNAAASNALEQQYNPYLNALRQNSTANLGQYLQMTPTEQSLLGATMGSAGQINPALANAATSANQQMALGGNLGQSLQNQIMRAGASASGNLAGPGGGLGMGRDISARDLGMTSLGLLQQRQNNAASIGGQAQNAYLQSILGLGGLANQIQQQPYQRTMGMSQFTQGIQQPQVGLSPSSAAGILQGNTNIANNANQQQAAILAQQGLSQGSLGGGLLGYGLNMLSQNPGALGSLGSAIGGLFSGGGGQSLNSAGLYGGDSAMGQVYSPITQ